MVGSHKLHPDVFIMAAGNKTTDKAVVTQMSTALQSRVIHYELGLDHKSFIDYAIKNDWDERVIGFLSFSPDSLMVFNPNHTEETFRCPRTWEFLSILIKGEEISVEDTLACAAGAIGEGGATEFLSFAEHFSKIPQISDIISKPLQAMVPRELATQFATIMVLPSHTDDKNAPAMIDYVKRFPIEQQILFLKNLQMKQPNLDQRVKAAEDFMKSLIRYLY